MYEEKEKIIKEQREMEANRKNLLGMEGKFGTILYNLGTPIFSNNFGMSNISYLPDFYALEEEATGLPTFDEDVQEIQIGLIFDGLSRGLNLEIKYFDEEKKLIVLWEGKPVFCQIENELMCYIPSEIWESKIDTLSIIAKKVEKKRYDKAIEQKKELNTIKKKNFLEKLKSLWGF